jgi:hypothetical protein
MTLGTIEFRFSIKKLQFVKKFRSHGIHNDQFYYPYGIIADADGNTVAVDYRNHCILIFDQDGYWKQTIGEKKDMEMVISIDNGILLYAKQISEYLLVIFGTILFNVLITEASFH